MSQILSRRDITIIAQEFIPGNTFKSRRDDRDSLKDYKNRMRKASIRDDIGANESAVVPAHSKV